MKNTDKIKKRVFEIIQIGTRIDIPSKAFDVFIAAVILINIAATFLITFDELDGLRGAFSCIEGVTIYIFIVEYILRLWTAGYLYPGKRLGALRFAVSFYGLVDLLTILSYFAPLVLSNGIVALRMLRVVRIMRLFKLNSSYDAFNVITKVLKEKSNQIWSAMFMIIVLMLASSMCMYSLEHDAQPDNFQNAFSGIWWSASTLLTVGYGDIYPITMGGRIMGIIIAFLGVGMVAIPTGIISAGFVEQYSIIKKGSMAHRNPDFMVLAINGSGSLCGNRIDEAKLMEGVYVAAVIRDKNVMLPREDIVLEEGDELVLVSMGNSSIDSGIEERTMAEGNTWIGKKISELDMSRRELILMIKRGKEVIKPQGSTVIEKGDILVVLDDRN